MLLTLIYALLVGIVVYILFSVFPPTKPYASPLALVIAILFFVTRAGITG